MRELGFALPLDSTLPDGWMYVPPTDAALEAANEVVAHCFPGQEIPDLRHQIDHPYFETTHVLVGPEDGSRIIGAGTLERFLGYGELHNFAVLHEARGRGIGKAILHKRLEAAQTNCHTLYVAPLAATNSLSSHYLELGFQKAADQSLSVGGRFPEPVSAIYERNKDLGPEPASPQVLTLTH